MGLRSQDEGNIKHGPFMVTYEQYMPDSKVEKGTKRGVPGKLSDPPQGITLMHVNVLSIFRKISLLEHLNIRIS